MNINSLLFFARDAQTKTPKVIKYLTKYGIEVHQALSDAGLAPVLYDTVHLKGGFMQVSCAIAFISARSCLCRVQMFHLLA